MRNEDQFQDRLPRANSFLAKAIHAFAAVLALLVVPAQIAQAQTYRVLYNFTGGQDGAFPESLAMGRAGNLYGTASAGGSSGHGTVFKFSTGSLTSLYSFADSGYGDYPYPMHQIMVGRDGTLYGTAKYGGGSGTVFNLRPLATACKTALCPWTQTVLYRFTGGTDGANPTGVPVFDGAGNIYGTTLYGGSGPCDYPPYGCGVVYKLTPSSGTWTESVLYSFNGSDGYYPSSGMIFDAAGDLYGTTMGGGDFGAGTVFTLAPSGSGWAYSAIHSFDYQKDEGYFPFGNLISDHAGNLYGSTGSGLSGGGTIFQLSPSDNGWIFSVLYSFTETSPSLDYVSLTMDSAGNLYGTTYLVGAYGNGSVFKLSPGIGGWTYRSLHDFCSDGQTCSDGALPLGLVLDEAGNLYGTALVGGAQSLGVIWEITP